MCVLGLPLLSTPEALWSWADHAQKGTKTQPPENLGKALLSWTAEMDAGEVENHCQQENRRKPDVALSPPTAHLVSLDSD